MTSVARLCVLAVILMLHISVSQGGAQPGLSSLVVSSLAISEVAVAQLGGSSGGAFGSVQAPHRGGAPAQGEHDAPEGTDPDGTTDARSTSMADDIFEILVLPAAVPRLSAVSDSRAGLGRDALCRGRPPPDTPDKPPRA